MKAPTALLLGAVAVVMCDDAPRDRPLRSVLMLSVDDLRTQMSPYPEGGPYMHTPNMQRIANRTVVFERAYVSVALCMPSRTALLTSRRPDTSRCWTIEPDQWFRRNETGQTWVTLPGAFKAANYLTLGMGKVFHETTPANDPQDARVSFSPEAYYAGGGQRGRGGLYDPDEKGAGAAPGQLAHQFSFGSDVDEAVMQDTNITAHAVATIERLANGSFGADVAAGRRPFFLAVGLHKPHVPWWCPARHWQHYPLHSMPLVPHPTLPTGMPAVAAQDARQCGDACNDKDIQSACLNMSDGRPQSAQYPLNGQALSAAAAAYQRQAYFACVSYTDENIGKILDAFDATPFARDAVLVFWGGAWPFGLRRARFRC